MVVFGKQMPKNVKPFIYLISLKENILNPTCSPPKFSTFSKPEIEEVEIFVSRGRLRCGSVGIISSGTVISLLFGTHKSLFHVPTYPLIPHASPPFISKYDSKGAVDSFNYWSGLYQLSDRSPVSPLEKVERYVCADRKGRHPCDSAN
jgi:hypothetical protein